VIADLPGVRKKNVNITINDNEFAISADAKRERDVKENEGMLLSERCAGRLYRGFTLGQKIDESRAEARYVDGVLELTLPKSAESMPKKIAVH
jgi:HSP20 family protein